MALAPNIDISIDTEQQDIQTSRTYKIVNNRIIGITDGIESLNQAIYKIINTERFEYLIYSTNYGIEKQNMMSGNYTRELTETELRRNIKEALLEDERILDVKDFIFSFNNDSVNVEFTVDSVFGETRVKKEVT